MLTLRNANVIRGQKSYFKILNHLFLRYIFCLLKLFKNVNFMKTQIFNKIKYDFKDQQRLYKTTYKPNHSGTFVYGSILIKIYMNSNTNIPKTQFFSSNCI